MKNVKKIISILMVASVTVVLLAGCSSKKSETTATSTDTGITTKADTNSAATDSTSASTDSTSTGTENKKFDPTAIKTLYSTTLKALVTDKTITQDQSDKVLEVVTKNMPTDGAKQGGTKPTGTAPKDGAKPTGDAPKDGTKHKDDRLSELVTSKVITQAQADTINQKIQEAMKNSQGN